MNIVTWAGSVETAQAKFANYFVEFDWQITDIEHAKVLSPDFIPDNEEFEGMVERAWGNPDAIICGKFHSYKAN